MPFSVSFPSIFSSDRSAMAAYRLGVREDDLLRNSEGKVGIEERNRCFPGGPISSAGSQVVVVVVSIYGTEGLELTGRDRPGLVFARWKKESIDTLRRTNTRRTKPTTDDRNHTDRTAETLLPLLLGIDKVKPAM
jgi:hypothetical protein